MIVPKDQAAVARAVSLTISPPPRSSGVRDPSGTGASRGARFGRSRPVPRRAPRSGCPPPRARPRPASPQLATRLDLHLESQNSPTLLNPPKSAPPPRSPPGATKTRAETAPVTGQGPPGEEPGFRRPDPPGRSQAGVNWAGTVVPRRKAEGIELPWIEPQAAVNHRGCVQSAQTGRWSLEARDAPDGSPRQINRAPGLPEAVQARSPREKSPFSRRSAPAAACRPPRSGGGSRYPNNAYAARHSTAS